jgi:hypothetical protein
MGSPPLINSTCSVSRLETSASEKIEISKTKKEGCEETAPGEGWNRSPGFSGWTFERSNTLAELFETIDGDERF